MFLKGFNYTPIAYGEGSRENVLFLQFLQSWHYIVQSANINHHPILLTTVLFHVIDCKLTVFLLRLNLNSRYPSQIIEPFKDEAQTALFKDPVRTAL